MLSPMVKRQFPEPRRIFQIASLEVLIAPCEVNVDVGQIVNGVAGAVLGGSGNIEGIHAGVVIAQAGKLRGEEIPAQEVIGDFALVRFGLRKQGRKREALGIELRQDHRYVEDSFLFGDGGVRADAEEPLARLGKAADGGQGVGVFLCHRFSREMGLSLNAAKGDGCPSLRAYGIKRIGNEATQIVRNAGSGICRGAS